VHSQACSVAVHSGADEPVPSDQHVTRAGLQGLRYFVMLAAKRIASPRHEAKLFARVQRAAVHHWS
jgi:hypothetical protein